MAGPNSREQGLATAKSSTAEPFAGKEGLPRLLAGVPLRSLGEHQSHWGPMGLQGGALIAEVGRAGLRGRGGAGFPAAVKLVAASAGRRPILVANATEGEPASAKDKTLLRITPHLVLDGAVAAAQAIGATEVVIAVDRGAKASTGAVVNALEERQQAGLDSPIRLRLEATPSRYLTGQETALVHWLNGGEAKPTMAPPRPTERGVGGRPTAVQNVETLAHLALIARYGADWYRQVGTVEDPGSTLLTITGAVERPGVYEVPLGTPVAQLVASAGGRAETSAGLLLGGYYGSWLPVTDAQVPLAAGPLAAVGASIGAGVLAVLPAGTCPLRESARVARWLAAQSAGQCGPCRNGMPAIAGALESVAEGERTGRAAASVARWSDMVEGRGACHLPDGAARFVRSTLAVFAAHVEVHRSGRACPRGAPVLATPAPGGWR
ncbi:MAG: SLBB domain-containing protein [Actinomycetota bacterium]|nr:SLBB domain-containing protein [Actinomycetota bacterium]